MSMITLRDGPCDGRVVKYKGAMEIINLYVCNGKQDYARYTVQPDKSEAIYDPPQIRKPTGRWYSGYELWDVPPSEIIEGKR
jgi:hypothetical protein